MRKKLFLGALVVAASVTASQAVIYDWDVGYAVGPLNGQGPWGDGAETWEIVAGEGVGGGNGLTYDKTIAAWQRAANNTTYPWWDFGTATAPPLKFSADFRVKMGPASTTTNANSTVFSFYVAQWAGKAERNLVAVNYTASGGVWAVDGVTLASPLADFNTTSDWIRIECVQTAGEDFSDEVFTDTTLWSLGADGSGAPVLIETISVTETNVMLYDPVMTVSIFKGDTNHMPNAEVFIDNTTVNEPDVLFANPTNIPGALVIDGFAAFADDASELQYTTDLASPSWNAVEGDGEIAPGTGPVRLIDPNPADPQRSYRAAN